MEKIIEKVPSWIIALSVFGLFILILISIYQEKPFKIAGVEFGATPVVRPAAGISEIIESIQRNETRIESLETVEVAAKKYSHSDVIKAQVPIGTVIASVLSPTNFSHYYGDEWIVADGRELNTSSSYFKITGKSKIPDLRGRFIRGMDLGANVDSEKGRVVGSPQNDSTKLPNTEFRLTRKGGHYHLQGYDATAISGKFGTADAGKHAGRYEHSPDPSAPGNKSSKTSNGGGHTHPIMGGDSETRPKNIALFYYIKIN